LKKLLACNENFQILDEINDFHTNLVEHLNMIWDQNSVAGRIQLQTPGVKLRVQQILHHFQQFKINIADLKTGIAFPRSYTSVFKNSLIFTFPNIK